MIEKRPTHSDHHANKASEINVENHGVLIEHVWFNYGREYF